MKQSSEYSEFIEYLENSRLCLFETDTVVGLGCKILSDGKVNPKVNEIYNIKTRSHDKALPWLISSVNMLHD